jgi:hypothetical protein
VVLGHLLVYRLLIGRPGLIIRFGLKTVGRTVVQILGFVRRQMMVLQINLLVQSLLDIRNILALSH